MSGESLTIKGIRQGLLITLGKRDWKGELEALDAHLGANAAFFRGGRVALDVGERELGRDDIHEAQTLLGRHEVELWALLSAHPATEAAAQELGLVVRIAPAPSSEPKAAPEGEEPPAGGVVVRRTLRSGQRVHHPGHVVVLGDVNPGAEIVAGGDVIVWGRLRGLVHAGALGNEEAVVCALELAPMQLRIAGHIARSPEGRRVWGIGKRKPKEGRPQPEMAVVRAEGRQAQIVAVAWSGASGDEDD